MLDLLQDSVHALIEVVNKADSQEIKSAGSQEENKETFSQEKSKAAGSQEDERKLNGSQESKPMGEQHLDRIATLKKLPNIARVLR